MLVVSQDHRVRHALHDRPHTRNRDIHVPHAVVVVFHLEQTGKVSVGSLHQIAELP